MALIPFIDVTPSYYETQLQTGYGMVLYKASPMQAGEGILNWIPYLSRIGPTLMNAFRAVAPSVKEVATDALRGAATAAINSGSDLLQNAVEDSSTLESVPQLSEAAINAIDTVKRKTLASVGSPQKRRKVTRRQARTVLD